MTNNSVNVCRYSYATAAIGIVAALVTACAMVRTVRDRHPLPRLASRPNLVLHKPYAALQACCN